MFYHSNYITRKKDADALEDIAKELNFFKAGHVIEGPGILFTKITPERIEELKLQFGDESNAVKQKGKELHI